VSKAAHEAGLLSREGVVASDGPDHDASADAVGDDQE
jgi:hypothetical protein